MSGTKLALDHPMLVRLYNPIAAMPSHHVAFAWVTGFGLARRATRRTARLGASAYPAVVSLIVVSTANHFVTDVAAGAVLGAVARRIAR
jgi:membrane-associated phospholipid phosphatase